MSGGMISGDRPTESAPWLLTELRRLERVTAHLGDDATLGQTLEQIVRAMAEALGTTMNSIYLVDEAEGQLIRGVTVGLPECFTQAAERVPIGEAGGSCGKAVASGSVVIIEDMRTDPLWSNYLQLSEEAGLRAVWSVPISTARGKVLGSFCTFYGKPRRPSQQEIELTQVYARHAAIAIENSRLYEQAERDRAQLKDIIDQMPEGVMIARASDGALVLINRAGLELTGPIPEGSKAARYTSQWKLQYPDGSPVPLSARPIMRALRGETARDQEYECLGADGATCPLLVSFGPLRQSDGAIFGGLVIFADLIERKRAEKIQAATYKISEAAHSAENLQSLFGSIHQIVGELMAARNFYIALCDDACRVISFPYFVDEHEPPPPPRRTGHGLTEYVLRSEKPLQGSLEVLEQLEARGEVDLIGARAIDWLGVPLRAGDKTIGALVIQSYTEGVRFGEKDKDILVFVSNQVAMAIERKQAEAELRSSEERFSKAFNASPVPMSITSLGEGRFIDVNESFLQVSGFSREEMIGRTSAEIGIWRDLEDHEKLIRAISRQQSVSNLEIGFRMKAGEIRTFLASVEVITLGGQECLLMSSGDITERKRMEKERDRLLNRERAARNEAEHVNKLRAELLVREQGARAEAEAARREWQTTFDTMTDGVLLVDKNDFLIRANHAFYRRLHLTPEQCTGRPIREVIHDREESNIKAENCLVCQLRGKGEHAMFELPPSEISSYPLAVTIDPLLDDSGEVVAVIQVIRDQSELYQAREQAERERVSTNAIIEQMGQAMLLFDERANVVRANQMAEKICGFTLDQMRRDHGNLMAEGRFSDESGRIIAVSNLPVQTALDERRTVETRLWYVKPDGGKILLSLTASPFFNDRGVVAGVIVISRDITEQQRESERTQQADKLRALGQLASGVAHNFNNALAAVIGYTQLALPKVKDPDIEKYLRVVEQSAKDAAHMVERIQTFSRGRSRTDDFIALRIGDILRDAIELTRPRWRDDAEALGIKYDVRLDWQAEEGLLVSGEPSELREVFVNIILNALDAMARGGALTFVGSTAGGVVSISVSDTGVGMTEEIKHRIFEPFFTTKGVLGLGMGLSESYRIVERHGGRIDIESHLSRGTTFTITLPLVAQVRTESQLSEVSPHVAARILVIDDEQFVRSVLAAMLKEQGHAVAEAGGAEEALRMIEAGRFDLVFTDLAMPKLDGIAAATEIKARWPATKVVLMSGYGADKASELAAGVSIDAAISKPFNMAEIHGILTSLLAGKS
jgi:PAS domain S-box-containing protein